MRAGLEKKKKKKGSMLTKTGPTGRDTENKKGKIH